MNPAEKIIQDARDLQAKLRPGELTPRECLLVRAAVDDSLQERRLTLRAADDMGISGDLIERTKAEADELTRLLARLDSGTLTVACRHDWRNLPTQHTILGGDQSYTPRRCQKCGAIE